MQTLRKVRKKTGIRKNRESRTIRPQPALCTLGQLVLGALMKVSIETKLRCPHTSLEASARRTRETSNSVGPRSNVEIACGPHAAQDMTELAPKPTVRPPTRCCARLGPIGVTGPAAGFQLSTETNVNQRVSPQLLTKSGAGQMRSKHHGRVQGQRETPG